MTMESALVAVDLPQSRDGGMANKQRHIGLDIARFFAFSGMVFVNFDVTMEGELGAPMRDVATHLVEFLYGKAAATFVVLAGIGLALSSFDQPPGAIIVPTLRRASFLLIVGLANTFIFPADILHYYAIYFLLGVFCLPLSNRVLIALIVAINAAALVLLVTLDYEAGWNWDDYTYTDFWQPAGFVRNLFYNGWHPILPWFGFLLFGFILSRLRLGERKTQNWIIFWGALVLFTVELNSAAAIQVLAQDAPDLEILLQTAPIPPVPLYFVVGAAFASLVIGLSLRLADLLYSVWIGRVIVATGQQTLSLYIAHILIGMTVLELLGLTEGNSASAALVATLIFVACAMVFSSLWMRRFRRGPVETIMRRLTG